MISARVKPHETHYTVILTFKALNTICAVVFPTLAEAQAYAAKFTDAYIMDPWRRDYDKATQERVYEQAT